MSAPASAQQVWSGPGTDFNTGANWTAPAAVPGAGDTAVFQNSGPTALSTSLNTSLGAMTFGGATSYSIALGDSMQIFGDVTNSSGVGQAIDVGTHGLFLSGATGTGVTYTVRAGGGELQLIGSSTGGDSTIVTTGFARVILNSTATAITIGSLAGPAGAIQNYGAAATTLTLGTLDTSTTFGGNIEAGGAGALSITKAGTGTLTLSGTNDYTGTTTISGGTLQIGDGGTTGTLGTGNVVNNAALAFNRGDDALVVGNAISGTGQLRQTGLGTTTLTGALSHTGGTFVDAGILVLGDALNAVTLPGDATVAASGTLMLQNGSLGSGTVDNSGNLGIGLNATAGNATINNTATGGILFSGDATAGTAQISNLSVLEFTGNATAANATITNDCCLRFSGSATAGNATIINNVAGNIDFDETSTAGNASISNAGFVRFLASASGGAAAYTGLAGSTLDFSFMTAPGATLGSLAGTGSVDLGGITLTVGGNGGSTTFAGVIADGGIVGGTGGGLTKVGAGTLTLTGANTYTGLTTISAGTLQIGAGGTSGTLGTGNVVNNAALAFSRSDAATVANAISGTGTVRQAGTGTTILTGANSYSGVTTISSGTLQVGAGGTTGTLGSGNVVNNAALAFNRSDAATLANVVSGTGTLAQNGTGNLILTATSTYTGATLVNAGRLSVNGSIATSSGVTVASGGTLGGTGSLPGVSVLSGGTLAPGNSIGTINVAGNLTLAPGSTTQIEVHGPLIDRINVAGTAALGGTLQLLAQGGSYTFNSPYTLIQAASVTGNFAAVNATGSFGAGVTSVVSTTANQATLTLTPAPLVPIVTPPTEPVIPPPVVVPPPVVKSAPVLGPAGTANQISVAAGFDRALAGGADVAAFFPLYNLPAAALPRGLDLVSGQIHAVAAGMHAQPAYQFLGAMLDPGRGSQALGDGADGSASRYAVWASGFGGGGRMGASGNPGTYAATASGGGVAVGADVRLTAQVVAGMALAGSGATTRLSDSMGRAETSQIQGAVYGTASFGALRLAAVAAYGGMDVTTRRTVPFLGIGDIRGRYTSQGVSTRLEAGWRMEGIVPLIALTPSVAFQGSWYETPGFTETGVAGQSAAALAVSGRNQGQSRMELSLRADMALTPTLSGFGRMGWAAYLQRDAGMTARFIGLANSGFSLGGARPDANAALLSGVDWRLGPAMTVTARVDAELASNSYAVNGTARIRYEF